MDEALDLIECSISMRTGVESDSCCISSLRHQMERRPCETAEYHDDDENQPGMDYNMCLYLDYHPCEW